MSETIVIELPEEKTVETPVEEAATVIEQAVEVVAIATELAEVIAEAGDDDEQVFMVHAKLDQILTRIDDLAIQVAELKAVEVAEILEEETPEEIVEIEAIADLIEEEEPEPIIEEVPVAVTPQIKKKKSTRWL